MAKHPDRCCYPGCTAWCDLVYLDRPLCDRHWRMIDTSPNRLRKKIGLPPFPPRPKPLKPKRRVLMVMKRGVVFGGAR